MKKKSLRWIELVGTIVLVAALAAIVLPALSRAREASDRASCQNNLKQWGAIFKMYASENSGYYPRCATKNERTNTDSPEHGFVAAPYGPSLYPNYVSDLNMFFCPSSEEKAEDYTKCPGGRWCNLKTDQLDARNFADCCYTYLGWAASEDEHFAAIVASLFLKDEIDPKNNPQTADNDL
ncbi:MAG: hypothetical protein RBU21_24175, partial [FCB group bacterium]|nr:hypothetical protein [FCB group bacterium]